MIKIPMSSNSRYAVHSRSPKPFASLRTSHTRQTLSEIAKARQGMKNLLRENLIFIADLAVDFLAVAGFLYLLSQGRFTNLREESLNRMFLEVGVIGLFLAGVTVHLLLKKE